MTDRAVEVPRRQQAERAKAHYAEISIAAMHSSSLIPQAIDCWEREPDLLDQLAAEREHAAAAVSAERQRCAAVCQARAEEWRSASGEGIDGLRREKFGHFEDAAVTLAAAILAAPPPEPPLAGSE